MIHVLAHIEISPGNREIVLREFHRVVPLVLAEAGCLEYRPTVDAATPLERQQRNPDRIIMIERWESVAHLEAHLTAAHMLEFRQRVQGLVVQSVLHIVEPA